MKYSIIVTAYNVERYLRDCLESIFKQPVSDYEVVLVNDASTDGTAAICQEYAAADDRIVLIDNDSNLGPSASRNLAIERSRGDYILFLDGDDYFTGEAFIKADEVLKDETIELLKYNILSDVAGELNGFFFKTIKQGLYAGGEVETLLERLLLPRKSVLFSANSYIYKKSLISDISFTDVNIYDGFLFVIETILKARTMYVLDTYAYYYRAHLKSKSLDQFIPKCKEYLFACRSSYELFEKNNVSDECKNALIIYLIIGELLGNLAPNSVIGNEYMRNPYPDEGRQNVRDVLSDGLVSQLFERIPQDSFNDNEKEFFGWMLEKDEEKIHNVFVERMLAREESLHERYGYVHPNEYCINMEKRVIYLVNPKVACSSLKAALSDYDYQDDYEVHRLQRRKTDMLVSNTLSESMKKSCFCFTFVREPFRRLVSAYESKYKSDLRMGFNQYLSYRGGIMAKDEGFETYLRHVCSIEDEYADRHFRSQYGLIYDKDGNQIPDFVGHIENIKEEYEQIREKYGLRELPVLNKTDKRDKKDWRSYYTEETAAMVYERYRKDFEVFGYEYSYEELKEYFEERKM